MKDEGDKEWALFLFFCRLGVTNRPYHVLHLRRHVSRLRRHLVGKAKRKEFTVIYFPARSRARDLNNQTRTTESWKDDSIAHILSVCKSHSGGSLTMF